MATAQWYDESRAAFAPAFPTSSAGDKLYKWVFCANYEGGAGCSTGTMLTGRTEEWLHVNNVLTKHKTAVNFKSRGKEYVTCSPLSIDYYANVATAQAVYNPSNQSYSYTPNASTFGTVSQATVCGSWYPLTTSYTHGPGTAPNYDWEMWVTIPTAPTSLCDDDSGVCCGRTEYVSGCGAYREIVLVVRANKNPPTSPGSGSSFGWALQPGTSPTTPVVFIEKFRMPHQVARCGSPELEVRLARFR